MASQNSIYQYVFSVVRRRWLHFIVPFVLILTCTIAAVLLWPTTYRSSATILVESQQIPGDLVRATVTTLADERIQVIEQRIRARDNLLKIMRKFSLFEDRRTRSNWLQSDVIELMRDRIEIERQALSGRRNRPTIAFKVSFEYEQPAMAARVANELVTYILSLDISTRTSRASETTKFLDKEKKRLEKELASLETQISEFKRKNKNSLPGAFQFNLNTLERAERRHQIIESEISKTAMQMKLLQSTGDIGLANIDGSAPQPGNLRAQLQRLKIELVGKEITFSDSHPAIRRLRNQIAAIEAHFDKVSSEDTQKNDAEQTVADNLDALTGGSVEQQLLKAGLSDLRAQEAALSKNIESLRLYVERTPQVELALTSLVRGYENLKKELVIITTKESEAALGEKLEENKQGERFEVIEQASVPTSPFKPNRLKMFLIGVMAAFAAGGGLVGALEMLDNHVRVSGDLVEHFNIVPMVAIPYIPSPGDTQRYSLVRPVAIGGAVAGVIIGLIIIDQFYLPLSLLADKALKFVFIRMG